VAAGGTRRLLSYGRKGRMFSDKGTRPGALTSHSHYASQLGELEVPKTRIARLASSPRGCSQRRFGGRRPAGKES